MDETTTRPKHAGNRYFLSEFEWGRSFVRLYPSLFHGTMSGARQQQPEEGLRTGLNL